MSLPLLSPPFSLSISKISKIAKKRKNNETKEQNQVMLLSTEVRDTTYVFHQLTAFL